MIAEGVPQVTSEPESQLKFAAQKLEQLFIHQLFRSLRKTSLFKGYPGSGFESQIFWSMWDDEVSNRAAERESLGLAPMIYHWLETQLMIAHPSSQPHERIVPNRSIAPCIPKGLKAKISSPFGWRTHPIYGHRHFHTGIDIALPKGYPIRTPVPGVVEFAGDIKGYGKTVIVRVSDDCKVLFAHMDSISVSPNDSIDAEKTIGTVGRTGNATGPHLHLEVRMDEKPIDPLSNPELAGAIERVLLQSEEAGG